MGEACTSLAGVLLPQLGPGSAPTVRSVGSAGAVGYSRKRFPLSRDAVSDDS